MTFASSPGLDLSFRRHFLPGRAPASQGSVVAKLRRLTTVWPNRRLLPRGSTVMLVLRVGVSLTSSSSFFKGNPFSAGVALGLSKVGRACTQPKGRAGGGGRESVHYLRESVQSKLRVKCRQRKTPTSMCTLPLLPLLFESSKTSNNSDLCIPSLAGLFSVHLTQKLPKK